MGEGGSGVKGAVVRCGQGKKKKNKAGFFLIQ